VGDELEEAKRLMSRLVQGVVSREEVADWAMGLIEDESTDYSSNPTLWTALDRLAGADLQQGPGVYLHDDTDFRAWLADLDPQSAD
jgi:hypothetical protein